MTDASITCKVLVNNGKGEPLVTHELERNRLEIDHGHRRTVIQLQKNVSVYVFSSNALDKEGNEKGINYGIPIHDSLGHTVASIRIAGSKDDDNIIIVRCHQINYYILIPKDTDFQVHEEMIEIAA